FLHARDSHAAKPDVLFALGALVSLWAMVPLARRATLRRAAVAGLAVGITLAVKYPAVILLVPGYVAAALGSPARGWRRLEPAPAPRPGRRVRGRLLRRGGHLARQPGALHDAAPARAGAPRGRAPGHGARTPATGAPRRGARPRGRAAGERRGARPDRVAHRHARARHARDGRAPAARRAGRDRRHAPLGVRRAADAARHRGAPRRARARRARGRGHRL